MNNFADIQKVSDESGGKTIALTLDNDKDTALVAKHLRPGKLIPFQDNSGKTAMTTKDIQGTNITMLVSRDTSGYSEGKMFLDQGETRSELINKEYEYYNFKLSGKSL